MLEAEKTHTVYASWEFLADKYVVATVENHFPTASKVELKGHIHEDRERTYFLDRFDRGGCYFREELRKRERAYKRKHSEMSAAERLEKFGVKVPARSKLFTGSWTKEATRRGTAEDLPAAKSRDPWKERVPTITRKGLVLQRPGQKREVTLSAEALLDLRAAGGDHGYSFAPSDKDGVKGRIVAMGVSLVVASAMRAAFERHVRGR